MKEQTESKSRRLALRSLRTENHGRLCALGFLSGLLPVFIVRGEGGRYLEAKRRRAGIIWPAFDKQSWCVLNCVVQLLRFRVFERETRIEILSRIESLFVNALGNIELIGNYG